MKAKNCKRCKGKGWLKMYRDRNGHKRWASDCIIYYRVGARVMKYLPVCPCTLNGTKRDKITGEKILPGDGERMAEYRAYQLGVSVESLAKTADFTSEQMNIRLCWIASYKRIPLRDAETVGETGAFGLPTAFIYHIPSV